VVAGTHHPEGDSRRCLMSLEKALLHRLWAMKDPASLVARSGRLLAARKKKYEWKQSEVAGSDTLRATAVPPHN
jgi:hypothetical protein